MANDQPQQQQYPQPWWLQPLLTIITQVGVPTVIAGVLLWFVLFRLDDTLRVIEREEGARTKMIAEMQANVIRVLENQTDKFSGVMQQNVEVNKRIADILERRREQP